MDFEELPEFLKDLKRLKKKYRSLENDLASLKDVLRNIPDGNNSKHWNCIHKRDGLRLYKVRLACVSLNKDSMRVIYAHQVGVKIILIELYFKGEQENENQERLRDYLNDN